LTLGEEKGEIARRDKVKPLLVLMLLASEETLETRKAEIKPDREVGSDLWK
jgi:hypothetical protein